MINTLIEGTSYFDIFQPGSNCLLPRDELRQRFADWNILHAEFRDFAAPGQTIKSFVTIIARKPERPWRPIDPAKPSTIHASTGRPEAFHSGKPSTRRRALYPFSRSNATASTESRQ